MAAVAVVAGHRLRISRRACSSSQDLPPNGPRRLPALAPVAAAAPWASGSYPPGVDAPERLIMDGYGLHPEAIGPPYTTLTAYDLNRGTIKWQIGLGDDPRLIAQGIRGTGAAMLTVKGSTIVTANGLLFVNAADQKVHVYDAETGKQIHEMPLGATTTGSPSMYEHDGRQYLLVDRLGRRTRRPGAQRHLSDGTDRSRAYALPRR